MNIRKITEALINSGVERNEAEREIEMLLEHFCHYSSKDKIMGIKPDEVQLSILEEKVQKRIEEKMPVQYIIGESWFMGENFKVTPDVLIPRDETEILVRRAIELIEQNGFNTVLDIGTGSGCIACTIAKNTSAYVLGIDISSEALRVSLDNVTKLGINNKAVFRKSDVFEKIREDEKFDLIISNPPYIPEGAALESEVMHEPHGALFAKDNGLEFYKKIISAAPEYIKDKGYLLFEVGINQSIPVKQLMSKDFKNIEIIKDLAGIERVISGQIKS